MLFVSRPGTTSFERSCRPDVRPAVTTSTVSIHEHACTRAHMHNPTQQPNTDGITHPRPGSAGADAGVQRQPLFSLQPLGPTPCAGSAWVQRTSRTEMLWPPSHSDWIRRLRIRLHTTSIVMMCVCATAGAHTHTIRTRLHLCSEQAINAALIALSLGGVLFRWMHQEFLFKN